ncbi:MAG: flagellar assembly protein FliH [Pseudomonadota bacterium]
MSTSKDGSVKIVPKEKSSEFQSWELPNVNFNGQILEDNLSMITTGELEKIHQQAYEEGYEEGKLKGLKEGFEEGEKEGKKQGHQQAFDAALKEIQEQTFHFEQLYKALENPLSLSNEQVEYELMNLAFSIAKNIINQEITTQPDLIISLVKKSLDLLPSASKKIKIYLNPNDILMVKESFSATEEICFDEYQIFERPNIKRGGCIVDTNLSHIDASIDYRINELAKNLIPTAPNLDVTDTLDELDINTVDTENNVEDNPNKADTQELVSQNNPENINDSGST